MRFAGRDYISPYSRIAGGGSVRGIDNIDGGVNWLLRAPGESCAGLGIADYIRLSSGAEGDTVIVDVKGGFGREHRIHALQKLINDCDRIFVVVDPSPSALMADVEKLGLFKSLEIGGADVVYVVNKMNAGVDVREMRSFIKVRKVVNVPFLAPEEVYASEYNCCTVYSMPKLAPLLSPSFEEMSI
jgi:MinD superfamily P-loop ATPase